MASQTDICNQALLRIGALPIQDINDDESPSARNCSLLFESIAKEVSREGDWACLLKRESLGRLTDVPAFEWAYAYQLPVDCMRIRSVNGVTYHEQATEQFEVEGRTLLSDAETAYVQYIAYVEDTSQWDVLFSNAVAALLASRLAVAIRQDTVLAQALFNEYRNVSLPRARLVNGNESKKHRYDPTSESRWVRSRYNSTNEANNTW